MKDEYRTYITYNFLGKKKEAMRWFGDFSFSFF